MISIRPKNIGPSQLGVLDISLVKHAQSLHRYHFFFLLSECTRKQMEQLSIPNTDFFHFQEVVSIFPVLQFYLLPILFYCLLPLQVCGRGGRVRGGESVGGEEKEQRKRGRIGWVCPHVFLIFLFTFHSILNFPQALQGFHKLAFFFTDFFVISNLLLGR